MTWAPGSYLWYACQVVTCVRRARQVEPLVSGQSVSCLRLCPLTVSPSQPGPDTGYCVSTNPTNSRCKFAARNPGLRHLLLHALIPHFVYRVVTSQDEEGGGAGDLGPICLEAWNTDSGDIPAGEDSDGIAECDFSQTSS